jgi:hypothetical protein
MDWGCATDAYMGERAPLIDTRALAEYHGPRLAVDSRTMRVRRGEEGV